ncbi:MAG: hypothetical protein KGJ79_03460 [Alphaproteobacteria bacterium]|nr:hypothetical protein [Alphaproteobacteria bacterium]MDE2110176.1 hypothetical protein [Alphaproteobacteria bacterium]MDE2492510.1 hypothetical protein [Alphaproteobacteria bacterium]
MADGYACAKSFRHDEQEQMRIDTAWSPFPFRPAAAIAFFAALIVPPAFAGPPFITDDPEPVDLHHWEVYAFSAATQVKGDFGGTLAAPR